MMSIVQDDEDISSVSVPVSLGSDCSPVSEYSEPAEESPPWGPGGPHSYGSSSPLMYGSSSPLMVVHGPKEKVGVKKNLLGSS